MRENIFVLRGKGKDPRRNWKLCKRERNSAFKFINWDELAKVLMRAIDERGNEVTPQASRSSGRERLQ